MARISPDKVMDLAQKISVAFLRRLFLISGLTPNQITWINFFINNMAAVACFAIGTRRAVLLGLLFCFISAAFDFMDGVVAREKKLYTKIGQWLDPALDNIWQVMLICAVIYGVLTHPRFINPTYMLPVGLFAVFSLWASNSLGAEFGREFDFDPFSGSDRLRQALKRRERVPPLDRLLVNSIFPGNFFFAVIFTVRYLIIAGALFNALDLAVAAIGLFKFIQLILNFYILYRFKDDRYEPGNLTVKILREISAKKQRAL